MPVSAPCSVQLPFYGNKKQTKWSCFVHDVQPNFLDVDTAETVSSRLSGKLCCKVELRLDSSWESEVSSGARKVRRNRCRIFGD